MHPSDSSRPHASLPSSVLWTAVAGLVGVATFTACGDGETNSSTGGAPSGGASSLAGASNGGSSMGGAPGSGGANPGGASSGGSTNEAGSTGEGGATGILSSSVVPDLTLEDFTSDCDELGGTVEVHSHCGGANGCQGLSYDSDTDVLTEHTCRGLNTCAGFSCVVP